jgi:hypothetical protein
MRDNDNNTKKDQLQPLTLEDLNISELEQRLELAAAAAACQCDKYKRSRD